MALGRYRLKTTLACGGFRRPVVVGDEGVEPPTPCASCRFRRSARVCGALPVRHLPRSQACGHCDALPDSAHHQVHRLPDWLPRLGPIRCQLVGCYAVYSRSESEGVSNPEYTASFRAFYGSPRAVTCGFARPSDLATSARERSGLPTTSSRHAGTPLGTSLDDLVRVRRRIDSQRLHGREGTSAGRLQITMLLKHRDRLPSAPPTVRSSNRTLKDGCDPQRRCGGPRRCRKLGLDL